MSNVSYQQLSWSRRWWIYQRERFPVVQNGIVVAVFSISTMLYSSILRNGASPSFQSLVIGFLSTFLFFLLLRIADEFKDFEEDSRFRSYRAVPRGVVTLKHLGVLGVFIGLLQLGMAYWLSPKLIFWLVLAWGYLALMSKEFFVKEWLKAHPIIYLLSHMVMMPMIVMYIVACDWVTASDTIPSGLPWLLLASYGNGIILEIGRKIRIPEDEEYGVETYSFLWGYKRATWIWVAVVFLTSFVVWMASVQVGAGQIVMWCAGLNVLIAVWMAVTFLKSMTTKVAQAIEKVSGLLIILLYLSLGLVPLLF
ncbi:UbiA family prenyltransferase [Brevibacillus sp. 7WMA2]|uniref:UbiA family prenyltransferase n=1 Tax=Brevibacillus TaxID=55080 RepID=UPI0013A77A6A|nr:MULTISPECIES: UbiA family prenyltransferase [Brevibacillus]MCR8993768.1 UbiA family prenyltransferase [Brevibacillus laterosporus]QIC04966.1 UbiA family prenyltransferase [Brevibacillus sp. 7WMA2]WPS85762.1 UbiA family prenyltransferase [Brevibacillus halotolerans]